MPIGKYERAGPDVDQLEFVRLIQQARELGMTLTELATALGKSHSSVTRWDYADSYPFASEARRLLPRLRRLLG